MPVVDIVLLLVSLGCARESAEGVRPTTPSRAPVERAAKPAEAEAVAEPEPWPPAKSAAKLQEEPKSEQDGEIKSLIEDYQKRLAALDPKSPLTAMNLPRLRENVELLYMEYNQDKGRYRGDHFNAKECVAFLKGDMAFQLDTLEKGEDPYSKVSGRWQGKAYRLESVGILGRYDLIVPKDYDAKKSWPLIFSFQSDPSREQMKTVPYFLVRCVQKGYPKGMVALEDKVRCILKDVARDFNIDPFRIYATGFSYGGHTCLVEAWRHPHWFAAIVPVCSDLRGGEAPKVKHIRNTPAYLLHGTGDSFLNTGRQVHDFMKEAGIDVKWDTYPGGHDSNVPFNENVKMLTDFFDQHVLDPYPKVVHHIVEHKRYSRAFWVDAILAEDKGGLAAVFTVSVKEGNRIEVEATEEIAGLELYLNDKLVDMKKPVTVVSGDKVLYKGKPDEKLVVKLREGKEYWRRETKPLWEQIVEIRKTAKP